MKKFIALLIVILCVQTACAAEADRAFFGVKDEMLRADYWIKRTKGAQKVLLTPAEIAELSARLKNSRGTHCKDVLAVPELMTRDAVLAEMKNFTSLPKAKRYIMLRDPDVRYCDTEKHYCNASGHRCNLSEFCCNASARYCDACEDFCSPVEHYRIADESYRDEVTLNANIDNIDETVFVRYAVVTSNGTLKALPCDDALYESEDDVLFDTNVVSTVKIWEPLAILHESRDGKFFFAIGGYCSGWISKEECALCDKETLREMAALPFLVVTGSRVTSDIDVFMQNRGRREFLMGTKLPIAYDIRGDEYDGVTRAFSRVVFVPERVDDGMLLITHERLPLSADVSEGYLPYTRANVIRQAFKMLGEVYGWGGSFGSRDCSAFVRDIYLTFGIELPRNSRAQATAPIGHIDTSKLEPDEKERILAKSGAGTLVQMPGHIMMYIGTYDKRPYIIHAAYSLGSRREYFKVIRRANCVVVSDMMMSRRDGKRIIDSVTNINVIR